MKNLFLAIIFSIIVFSCGSKISESELIPEIVRVSIPITSDQLNSYQVLNNYSESGSNKLIAYNGARHSLDFFDLDKSEVIRSEKLDKEGPNGIGAVESVYWHNSDSIFMYERGKVHILKEGGQKVNSIDFYELFTGKNLGEPVCNFYFKLNFLENEKLIFFSLIYHGVSLEERAALPLVASLNLETLEVKPLSIRHTQHYKKVSGNVGFITYLGFQDFMKDRLIYNFQYESTLFAQNVLIQEKSDSEVHEMKFTPELLELENIDQHAIDNPHFLTPIPDNHRNLIYRGIWDSPDTSLPESGFTEKKISIAVFDSDLSLITYYSLPNYTYQINNWFVNENGLYLNYAHPRNEKVSEDFLVFHVFQFDQAN
ncbi:DUF4221 family protein [Algoriphagus sp.]|uniref:DUF4221 family protein n=1 Tax=Algoriphagus sp. TaxID=1872435 RepID=UPI003918EA2B